MKIKRLHRNIHNRPLWLSYSFDLPASYDDFNMRDAGRPSFVNTGVSTPAVNIIETNDDFRLDMVAPGMKKDSFKIEFQNNMLTITYDHADNREGDRADWNYLRHEYNYHSFSRSFTLPETIEGDKIQAKYEDGILMLVIPKKEEARKKPARQIAVQ
jgi:HSP20 family protein